MNFEWTPSPRVRLALKWAGYPLFYGFVLLVAIRVSFPFDRLKQRVIAEYNAQSAKDSGTRLEIDDLSGSWLFGVEAEGVRLMAPGAASDDAKAAAPKSTPSASPAPSASGAKPLDESAKTEGKASSGKKLAEFAELDLSFSVLRLLFGTKAISFSAETSGGKLSGRFVDSSSTRELQLELEKVNLSQFGMLTDSLNVPLGGIVTGTIEFEAAERKLAKAQGKLELAIDDFSVGDGKTKLRGALALPKVSAGQLAINAEIEEGKLQLNKFAAKGPDVEAEAEGQVTLRDPLKTSLAGLTLRYKFSERYMGKNDMTKGLFGDPATGAGGLMDMDPKVKKARTADGFYAWRITGALATLGFQPASESAATAGAAAAKRARKTRAATKK